MLRIVVLVALLASAIPARRAARIDSAVNCVRTDSAGRTARCFREAVPRESVHTTAAIGPAAFNRGGSDRACRRRVQADVGCTVHHQTAAGCYHLYVGETGCQQRLPLFGNRHVEQIILKTTVTEEVVAHQISSSRLQNLFHRSVKLRGIFLVPQFMDGLVRNHGIEEADSFARCCGPVSYLACGVMTT